MQRTSTGSVYYFASSVALGAPTKINHRTTARIGETMSSTHSTFCARKKRVRKQIHIVSETEAKQRDLCASFIIHCRIWIYVCKVIFDVVSQLHYVPVDCVAGNSDRWINRKTSFALAHDTKSSTWKWILQSSMSRINLPLIRSMHEVDVYLAFIRMRYAADGVNMNDKWRNFKRNVQTTDSIISFQNGNMTFRIAFLYILRQHNVNWSLLGCVIIPTSNIVRKTISFDAEWMGNMWKCNWKCLLSGHASPEMRVN